MSSQHETQSRKPLQARIPSGQQGRAARSSRPTFGFLVNWGLTNPYSSPMWWGMVEAAETLDVNLVGFGNANIYDAQLSRSLYWQIQPATLDGLILVNPTMARLHPELFNTIPVVNIGHSMEGVVTSIMVDNYDGMRAAVRHMIEVHGYRRLAFIKGPLNNPDADQRFQAYLDELRAHNLTVDPRLLYQPADWSPEGGEEAIQVLMDERGQKFEALIAANDNMALAVIAALQARGLRVPYDVAVCGFDDSVESATNIPPLTTVRQPLRKLGRLALEALLAHYQRKGVPPKLILPTTQIVRRSCGCFSEMVASVNEGAIPFKIESQESEGTSARALLNRRQNILLSEVQRAIALRDMPALAHTAEEWLEAMITSLENEDDGKAFLRAIDLTCRRLIEQGVLVANLQDALSTLRREGYGALVCCPSLLSKAENLWHRARVFLNEVVLQQQSQQRMRLNEQMEVLRAISQTMAVTFHLDTLLDILARDLGRLGIEGCYLALYEGVNRPAEWVHLILAYDHGQRLALKVRPRYPTADILPPHLWGDRRRTFILETIEFQSEEMGFILFEVGPQDGAIYEALRSQLSSSIKGALLFDERDHLLAKTTRLYRQAAIGQRLAEEASRLKSRFLSMVSHELCAPLKLIAGLSEMMLKEAGEHKEPQTENLKLMHTTASHLDGLLRDVLDLARDEAGELRLICEPLDMAKVLEAVAVVGEQLATERGLHWEAHIPSGIPLIWGDPTRIRQIVLNLINNAVKFTERGEIRLAVTPQEEYLTISVSDTGLGIDPAEQKAIFDEFRQADRTTARGYGGLGLGLAICKRLVEMHGGQIGVRSSGIEGEGATFFFTLPTLKAISTQEEPLSSPVWILTRQPAKAQPLKQHLEEQGFSSEIVEWDKEGRWLQHAMKSPPTAVVLDVQTTRRHGLAAMRALRAHPTTSHVPVLFYTMDADADHGVILELDYLTKPVNTSELKQALRRLGWEDSNLAIERVPPKTILIVDDDPGVLEFHAQIVRSAFPQHQVRLASGGQEALEIMQTDRPDLVLLDLMMPNMDGFAVLEAMQAKEHTRRIPVIVLSAKTLTEEEIKRLDHSVAAILHKGMFSAAETLNHIREALQHRQRLKLEAKRLTRKAMAYIHEHYAEPIGREDIAHHVGVSEGYLSRCFTQETGLSLVRYLTRYRLQQAKQLLTSTNMTITEIAMEVGFSDSNYFSRVFRQEAGISPAAYRRAQQ